MSNNKQELTIGVRTLLGNPRKAILKLSFPMIVGMFAQTIYNIADGVWVAGLGKNALAAIGLFFPVFMIIISLSVGVGIGCSSAISRSIGQKNKNKASSVAAHSLIIGFIIGSGLSIFLFVYLKDIFSFMGAKGKVLQLGLDYGKIIAAGSLFLVFSHIGSGILRGEGDTKRAMIALILGSGLNIIIDPIFIYILGMGIKGASLATVISIIITSFLIAYWMFVENNTYVTFNFKKFFLKKDILQEILTVGIPTAFSQAAMAMAMFILNIIVIKTAGSLGVAVFTSAWRIVMIGIVPLLGVATAVVSVSGTSFGAKDIKKLNEGYIYAIKTGLLIELFIASFIFIFAPKIAYLFSYSKNSHSLYYELVNALRFLVLFLPGTPLGMLTSAMFQGIGKGINSLMVTIFRTLIMQVFFSYLLGIFFKFGLQGVWLGIVLGNLISAIVSFNWGRLIIKSLQDKKYNLSEV